MLELIRNCLLKMTSGSGSRCSHAARSRPWRRLQLESLESRTLLTTVQLSPIANNTLYQDTTGSLSDGAGQFLFAGETNAAGGGARRALVDFNIAAAVPAGAQINSVSLSLHVSKSNSGFVNIGLNTLLASWGEGTVDASGNEGAGAPATTGSATWLHRFYNQTFWSHPGGDFTSTPSATTSVGGIGFVTWTSTQMTTDVQNWLNNPSIDFGWMVKEIDESVAGTAKQFDSRANVTTADQPLLTIQYTVANVNHAPTVAAAASATANPVTGTTTSLSVLGADVDTGESTLSYTWSTTGTPPAAVTFSSNGTNAAKNDTATFTAAGLYHFLVTITDPGGLTATSNIDVTVNQTLKSIVVSPSSVSLNANATQAFGATGDDQFGVPLTAQPTFTWSSNVGSITSAGAFTAQNVTGSGTVTATSGSVSGTANVTVTNNALTVANPIAQQYTLSGSSFSLPVPANTFADGDMSQTQTLSATRADGTALPSWLTFNVANSTFQGTPQVTDIGIISVKLTDTVSGQAPLSASTTFSLIVANAAAPWQNPANRLDVDADGVVVPLDVLRIINQLNNPTIANPATGKLPAIAAGNPHPPPFMDVNGDGFVAPIDALSVINFLNSPAAAVAAASISSPTSLLVQFSGGRANADLPAAVATASSDSFGPPNLGSEPSDRPKTASIASVAGKLLSSNTALSNVAYVAANHILTGPLTFVGIHL